MPLYKQEALVCYCDYDSQEGLSPYKFTVYGGMIYGNTASATNNGVFHFKWFQSDYQPRSYYGSRRLL